MSYIIKLNTVPPPGASIREAINELCISQKELALRTGLAAKTVSLLMNGKAPITASIADKLEYVTDIPCSIWLNLENNYRLYLKRKKSKENPEVQAARAFTAQFPYSDLVKRGACPNTRDAVERKDALLRFFGVTDPSAYANTYIAPMEGAARVGASQTWNAHAFAAWLRLAELQAQKIETAVFSPKRLQEAVQEIREILSVDVAAVWGRVQEILASAGVAAVVEPELKGCHIFGFSRFIAPQKALLTLTLRRKSVGTFWFNLFHELCHLLKHSKKKTFYNFDNNTQGKRPDSAEDREEAEADAFSRDILIPRAEWAEFTGRRRKFSIADINDFAKEQRIPSDVVLGRLQWEKLVRYSNTTLKSCKQAISGWTNARD